MIVVSGNGIISLNPEHKYATQINSQITIIGAQQGYFVVCTKKTSSSKWFHSGKIYDKVSLIIWKYFVKLCIASTVTYQATVLLSKMRRSSLQRRRTRSQRKGETDENVLWLLFSSFSQGMCFCRVLFWQWMVMPGMHFIVFRSVILCFVMVHN